MNLILMFFVLSINNMTLFQSIQSDINQIIAENSHLNWTYERRLKLEQMLLLVTRPAFCFDSSPIAGLAVHLQHQMLSVRDVELNPLKNGSYSKKNSSEKSSNNISDNILPISKLSNKTFNRFSKSMVSKLYLCCIYNIDYKTIDCSLAGFLKAHRMMKI